VLIIFKKSCTSKVCLESGTDLKRVDAMTDVELERIIAEDEAELDLCPDWTRAKLVIPEPRKSVRPQGK
jgi:hypothetical protein